MNAWATFCKTTANAKLFLSLGRRGSGLAVVIFSRLARRVDPVQNRLLTVRFAWYLRSLGLRGAGAISISRWVEFIRDHF
jgi:hypothetical protein